MKNLVNIKKLNSKFKKITEIILSILNFVKRKVECNYNIAI